MSLAINSPMYLNDIQNAGGKVYEVGGTVRDNILGRTSKDRDLLVTGLPIDKIAKLLKPHGKVTFVGQSFGVLKFSAHSDPQNEIDIAIPRKEISTGAGHRDFKVEYDPSLPVEIDLGRRDFTVNAMAFDIAGKKLVDPFDGKKDLANGILRQVFKEAFLEDPLRLLRAIQFAARFDLNIEPETWDSMIKNAELIKTVSAERVIEELKKLMTAKKPSLGFKMMADTGLLKHVLPELAATIGIMQAKQAGDDVFMHTMKVLDAARSDEVIDHAGDMNLLFAALLHDIGKSRTEKYSEKDKRVVFFGHQIVSARMARKILNRLKATIIGIDPETVCRLIDNHMFETKSFFSERAIRRFINKISPELIYLLVDLRVADNRGGKYPAGIKGVMKLKGKITEVINKKPPFGPKDLAVNGHDIMEMGVPEGRLIGLILNRLVDVVLDEPEMNTREQLIAIASDIRDNPPETKPSKERKAADNGK